MEEYLATLTSEFSQKYKSLADKQRGYEERAKAMLKRFAETETQGDPPELPSGPVAWQDDLLGVSAPTRFNKGSDGLFASTYIFQFGWRSALPGTTILHLPIEGVNWSTIEVQKSTIYLQSTLAARSRRL